MANRIAIFEGSFDAYRRKRRKHRKGGTAAQKARFKSAAKACKGKGLKAFRACMRKKLKR